MCISLDAVYTDKSTVGSLAISDLLWFHTVQVCTSIFILITVSWNCSFYRKLSLSTNCIEKIANLNGLSKSMEVHCIDLIHFDFLWQNMMKCGTRFEKCKITDLLDFRGYFSDTWFQLLAMARLQWYSNHLFGPFATCNPVGDNFYGSVR